MLLDFIGSKHQALLSWQKYTSESHYNTAVYEEICSLRVLEVLFIVHYLVLLQRIFIDATVLLTV